LRIKIDIYFISSLPNQEIRAMTGKLIQYVNKKKVKTQNGKWKI